MQPMRVLEHDVGEVTVLELDGRLILEEGELPLRDAVDRLVAQGRVNIVVDLGRTTQIDSAGIGMLVSKYLTAFRHGGKIKLVHLSAKANQLLHFTRLCDVFETFASEDEAARSFAAARPT
jgi:anti-sigma B factor antagonist